MIEFIVYVACNCFEKVKLSGFITVFITKINNSMQAMNHIERGLVCGT